MVKKRKTRKQKIRTSEKRGSEGLEYSLPTEKVIVSGTVPTKSKSITTASSQKQVSVPHLEMIKSDLVKTVVLAGLIIGLEIFLYYLNTKYGWIGGI